MVPGYNACFHQSCTLTVLTEVRCVSISDRAVFKGVKHTLHGGDIRALDVVLELCELFLKFVEGDELVLNNEGDLELLDTVTDGNKLGTTPNETFLLDGTDRLLESLQVSFIVPRLNIKCHNGLHDVASM
jgi:hypothetical protein